MANKQYFCIHNTLLTEIKINGILKLVILLNKTVITDITISNKNKKKVGKVIKQIT
jgi:hypothetical protein